MRLVHYDGLHGPCFPKVKALTFGAAILSPQVQMLKYDHIDMIKCCRPQNEPRGLYSDLPIHTIGIGPEISRADSTMALGPPDMV